MGFGRWPDDPTVGPCAHVGTPNIIRQDTSAPSPSPEAPPANADTSLRSHWYRVFAATLALSLLSAVASISVVIYISRSLQSTASTVDEKAAQTNDLRTSLADQLGYVHQLIDVGSRAAEPFQAADARTNAVFDEARSTYTTSAELDLLAQIDTAWRTLVDPFRPIAADPAVADAFAAEAALDGLAKSEAHFELNDAEQQYQLLLEQLYSETRLAIDHELDHASNLVWALLTMLVLLFSASVAASIFFARRMSGLVTTKTDELRYQALHDSLTGLPNRALIADRVEQLLVRNRRNGTDGAALFIDLDEFKNVNDTLGHDAGDRLLRAVTARLSSALRDADTIGRLGGDEFVVLVDGGAHHAAPELIAERLLDVMRQPFVLDDSPLPLIVTTSVGIAAGDRTTPGDLLRDADVALYRAKAAGKNCFVTFHADMEMGVDRRNGLEFDLRSALDAGQFRLAYQPIYNLNELTVVGVEALIRWEHPTLGTIQPDDFIPMLETSGHIIEVGRWVLREACAQMVAWRARGSDLTVSVNVSGRQLDRDSIVDHVREALESSGLAPSHLTVEITETVLMNDLEGTSRRLQELKDLGVQIAIDDFGTGYCSLAYLQRLPIDCLKIDRSFTDAITRTPESEVIIQTLVQLGRSLGLKTLAEGVENTGQVDYLRDQMVNEAQGFLLARPLDAATLEDQILDPILGISRPSETRLG
jgi:diguanylate cyclase (GGDEF)-like protein